MYLIMIRIHVFLLLVFRSCIAVNVTCLTHPKFPNFNLSFPNFKFFIYLKFQNKGGDVRKWVHSIRDLSIRNAGTSLNESSLSFALDWYSV